jgi:hypothetical protein
MRLLTQNAASQSALDCFVVMCLRIVVKICVLRIVLKVGDFKFPNKCLFTKLNLFCICLFYLDIDTMVGR